jgi:hypothetical protein
MDPAKEFLSVSISVAEPSPPCMTTTKPLLASRTTASGFFPAGNCATTPPSDVLNTFGCRSRHWRRPPVRPEAMHPFPATRMRVTAWEPRSTAMTPSPRGT